MKHDEIVGYCGSLFGGVMTYLQTNETLQIIQGVLSIVAVLITIAYTIWKWYRKASKDGKITPDEVDELFDDLKEITKDEKEGKK